MCTVSKTFTLNKRLFLFDLKYPTITNKTENPFWYMTQRARGKSTDVSPAKQPPALMLVPNYLTHSLHVLQKNNHHTRIFYSIVIF